MVTGILPLLAQSQGDVNTDGAVDIVDALLIAQYYVGLNPAQFNSAYADVNCSGGIDIVDALLVAQYYVGLIGTFPCENPTPTPVSGDTGYWDVRDNQFINCTGSMPTTSTCTCNPPYSYQLHSTDQVKSIVQQYAGAGKI